jgi:hypothetical protein
MLSEGARPSRSIPGSFSRTTGEKAFRETLGRFNQTQREFSSVRSAASGCAHAFGRVESVFWVVVQFEFDGLAPGIGRA